MVAAFRPDTPAPMTTTLHVASRSPDDLRDFVVRYLSASKDVAGTETSLIFERVAPGTGLT